MEIPTESPINQKSPLNGKLGDPLKGKKSFYEKKVQRFTKQQVSIKVPRKWPNNQMLWDRCLKWSNWCYFLTAVPSKHLVHKKKEKNTQKENPSTFAGSILVWLFCYVLVYVYPKRKVSQPDNKKQSFYWANAQKKTPRKLTESNLKGGKKMWNWGEN